MSDEMIITMIVGYITVFALGFAIGVFASLMVNKKHEVCADD